MSNNAPVNVFLPEPKNKTESWKKQRDQWIQFNNKIGGNPDFYPLTIKAAYVIGIIHNICDSVSILLSDKQKWDITYMSAYGIFTSGLDILGRCIKGNESTNSKNTEEGFIWLIPPDCSSRDNNTILLDTLMGNYSIGNLIRLRNNALHGQAQIQPLYPLDFEILGKIKSLHAKGIQRYWFELLKSKEFCNNLALATIIPFRNFPVKKCWTLFEKDKNGNYNSVEEIFNQFDWTL